MTVRYARLGSSRLEVLRPVPGNHEFRTLSRTRGGLEIMDSAHAAGINYFDTANTYSAPG